MAGLLDTIGRGLVGAAKGYGNYLIGEGERRNKQAENDALLLREQALAKFRQGIDQENAQVSSKLRREETSHAENERRVSTRGELALREGIGIREEKRTEGRQVRAESRAEMRAIREDDRTLNRQLKLQEAQAARESQKIERWVEDDKSGTVVGITAGGKIWDSGVPFVRKKDGGSFYGDLNLDSDSGTGATAKPVEAPAGASPVAVGTIIRGPGPGGKIVRKQLNANGQWVTLPN